MLGAMAPVVLHHGLFGTGNVKVGPLTIRYFRGIEQAIADRGHPVIVTRVHPTHLVETRARQLKADLLRRLRILGHPSERAILIGHSMGGLDARYAVSKLGLDEFVSTVVTVSTPNRGSPFADWVVRHLGEGLKIGPLLHAVGIEMRAVIDVTTWNCAEFNETVPNVPGVDYFSISAARPWSKMPPFAMHSHRVISKAEGDNDGLVSIHSAKWGTHLGTWPADHWQTTNRRFAPALMNPKWSIVPYWMRMMDAVIGERRDSAASESQQELVSQTTSDRP